MRWRSTAREWKVGFALFPSFIQGHWIWLERFWFRQRGVTFRGFGMEYELWTPGDTDGPSIEREDPKPPWPIPPAGGSSVQAPR